MSQPPTQRSQWIDSALSRYERPLLRYATRLLRDADRARDVVQDTFLRLCREEPERLDGHLAAWLFTVCRRRAVDLLRRSGRTEGLDEGTAAELPASEQAPDRALEEQEALRSARAVIAGLPARQQEVLRLKFQEGLSYKEIGAVTGFTVSYVGVLIHEALKVVRARVDSGPALSLPRRKP